jgi:multidrug resistance efflux pump
MTRSAPSTTRRLGTVSAPAARQLLGGLLALAVVFCCGAMISTAEAKPNKHKKAEKKDEPKAEPAAKAVADKKDAAKSAAEKETAKDAKIEAKKESESAKPATHRVKKELFRIELALDGVFEAQNMAELILRPQEWSSLIVLKAAEHGSAVKQGDLILTLDTEKIDRAIADLRSDIQLSDLALKQAEEQLAAAEKTAPLDNEANQRSLRIAEEDWKLYLQLEKPLSVKLADYQLKMAQEMLEYQEEEYRQLEKMYRADDLREETEKIVLRRAKNAVERAKFNVEYSTVMHDETQKFLIPRQEERYRDSTQRAVIDADRTKVLLPVAMSKHRLEVEKLKVARAQSEEKLNKLMADRSIMTVKAPIDGILYYGKCVRGKWSGSFTAGEPLRRGATVMPNDVVMTVVQVRPMFVRTTVPESQLLNVYNGLQAVVEPAGAKNVKLTALARSVGAFPLGSAGFDAQFTLALPIPDFLVPGMTCELKAVPWQKKDALTVPPKSVFTDELDLTKQYVYVLGKGDKPEKRTVVVGKHNEKQADILQGLAEGDQVLLEKPKD